MWYTTRPYTHRQSILVWEGAKNSLRGVGVQNCVALGHKWAPTFGREQQYPPFFTLVSIPPSVLNSIVYTPHMEKVCMRFPTCITPK